MKFLFTANCYEIEESPWQEEFTQNPWMLAYDLALKGDSVEDEGMQFVIKVASLVIQDISQMPDIEFTREDVLFSPEEEEVTRIVNSKPFSKGDSFVDDLWVRNFCSQVLSIFKSEITNFSGTVESYFTSHQSSFKTANRIFFHLVENKKDEYRPFAFLATYANADSRHIPLQNSLIEFKKDQKALLNLLAPLSKIAEKSSFISNLIETGELFKPIGLTAQEAYTFLKEIPIYEESQVFCRIPNFWKKRTSHKIRVGATVGEKRPSRFGLNELLDFSPCVIIDGKKLTKKELKALLNEAEGLRLIKGQWVEVNHQELQLLLDRMNKLSDLNSVNFSELLRLQMGMPNELGDDIEVDNGQWLKTLLVKLQGRKSNNDFEMPNDFKANLRPYQKIGYEYLMTMNQMGLGACLADDMGLGKTIQVLAQMTKILQDKPDSSILLVLPTSLVGNWVSETNKFAPSLKVTLLTQAASLSKAISINDGLYITTYGLLSKLDNVLGHEWTLAVLDEAQAIKNSGTIQSRAVKKIKANNRLVLTGTPVENSVADLWSLFDFLNPGLLGTKKQFANFTKPMANSEEGFAPLRNAITPFILRRMKTDKSIINDLPDKIEEKEFPVLTNLQAKLYKKIVDKLSKDIDNLDGIKRKGIVLATIMGLKQICNHPDQYSGQQSGSYNPEDSGKFLMLESLCSNIRDKRERVLIFTQFREIIPALDSFLTKIFGQKGLCLDGSTPAKVRTQLVKQFNDEAYCPYFILSLKAGGVGLNLTSANHVIHFDRWWNPAVENQATDRAYRIGQKRNVIVHTFATKGTIEEKIDLLLEEKRNVSEQLLKNSGEGWITELNNDQILNLCSLEEK